MSDAYAVRDFVASYVERNGRGCPKGELQFVGKFSAKDIKKATAANLIESGRGSEGGFFVYGTKPIPTGDVSVTLKSRMVDQLRLAALGTVISADTAKSLIADYELECTNRAKAQKAAAAKKASA